MLKYFKHLSIRLFFVLLGILLLLTAWSLVYAKQHVLLLLTASLLVLGALAWWLARSISRIAFIYCYINDKATLRSAMFGVNLLCIVALFIAAI